MVNDFPVGEVLTSADRIQWRISDFLEKVPQRPGTTLLSPVFLFNTEICMLELSPNGHAEDATEGWVGLLCEIYSLTPISAIRCSVLDHWGREVLSAEARKVGSVAYVQERWIWLEELLSRREEILPHGQLHVVCTVLSEGDSSVEERESGGEVDEADSVEKNNSYSDVVNEGLHDLSQSLKDLYLGSKDCDLIIKVKDREFHAHRLLLKARSPTFDAMLSHNMLERNSGIITIEDCDPQIFNDFLIFMYSGRLENITSHNMCGLYQLADKYDLPVLKNRCLNFIRSSLSVERICDVIWLAEKYEEIELLTQAVIYFINNIDEILDSQEWLLFMEENAAVANLLIQQTLMFYKTKLPRCIK